MNLPTKITFMRIVGSPLFIISFYLGWHVHKGFLWVALALVIAFEITDLVDGLLARRWGQVTDLGKVLDPFADCISRFSVFLCFMSAGYAHIFMVALIFYRDIIVANIRIAAAMKGTVIHARTSGKIKAVAQAAVILTVMFGINLFGKNAKNFQVFSLWAMGGLTAVTVWSGLDYLLGYLRVVRPVPKKVANQEGSFMENQK